MSKIDHFYLVGHIFSCEKLIVYNRLVVSMGGVFQKDASWKVVTLMITIWLKMENVCIFCNVIQIFWWKKQPKQKDESLLTF
jgi:hypothetical protein